MGWPFPVLSSPLHPLSAWKGLFGELAAVIKVFSAHVRAVFNILFPARSGAVFHDTGNAINYSASPAYLVSSLSTLASSFLFAFPLPPFFQPFFARLMLFDAGVRKCWPGELVGELAAARGKTGGTVSINQTIDRSRFRIVW